MHRSTRRGATGLFGYDFQHRSGGRRRVRHVVRFGPFYDASFQKTEAAQEISAARGAHVAKGKLPNVTHIDHIIFNASLLFSLF